MKTGMVIIHYNDIESVTNLINNVKDYKCIDRIIIYDNNSQKNIKEKLKKLKNNKVKIVEGKQNKGYSYAINDSAKELIKEFGECNIIISNADIIIQQETDIKELINLLNKPSIGLVAPTIVEGERLNRGWKQPSPLLDSLLNMVYIHHLFRQKYIKYPEEHYNTNISIVDVVSGCFFLIKSKILESVNYLDENIFLYYEENILAKKLEVKKKKILVSNQIKVIHNHSISIDKNMNNIKKLRQQKKSQYYFQTEYNDANLGERALLKITAFLNRIVLIIIYFIKDIIRVKKINGGVK